MEETQSQASVTLESDTYTITDVHGVVPCTPLKDGYVFLKLSVRATNGQEFTCTTRFWPIMNIKLDSFPSSVALEGVMKQIAIKNTANPVRYMSQLMPSGAMNWCSENVKPAGEKTSMYYPMTPGSELRKRGIPYFIGTVNRVEAAASGRDVYVNICGSEFKVCERNLKEYNKAVPDAGTKVLALNYKPLNDGVNFLGGTMFMMVPVDGYLAKMLVKDMEKMENEFISAMSAVGEKKGKREVQALCIEGFD
jgi:hypothetical protein